MYDTGNYSPVQSILQRNSFSKCWGMRIKVGKEYEYLGNRVKVLEINANETRSSAEVHFETGFGERGVVDANELGPWKRRKKRTEE